MKTALVTGPTSGIGRATALELARRGFHVVAAARSEEKTRAVLSQIRSDGGSAEYLHVDLASLASAREAANTYAGSGRPLDVLVNNAGVGGARGASADGFEIHFGVNHLGHFMLTHHLDPAFRKGTRIVVVSSEVHRRVSGIDFDRVQKRGSLFRSLDNYGVSKLANILFTRELARLRPDLSTYGLHPGVVDTNIFPAIAAPLFRNKLTPEEGAQTSVWCATSDDVAHDSGRYYSKCQQREPSAAASDDALARELWERSEAWCAVAEGG